MTQAAIPDAPLIYTYRDLLDDGDYSEPLIANGVRCHGGFLADGSYRSPRTIHRTPAIDAWQQALRANDDDLIELSHDLLPPQYPNVEQSVLLCRNGVRDPVVRALTIISVVEGFGAIIRDVIVPDLDALLVEPTEGSSLAHLSEGLFEAHARDEAGWGDQGGHKQMWEAARDLAFESPEIPPDVLMRIMGRGRRARKRERRHPRIHEKLESMIGMMANVLIVEIFAEEVFGWGKAVLSNPEISAAPEAAAAMVGYIQTDEKPHVEYLRTALSEIAARTIRAEDGATLSGRDVVHATLHATLSQVLRNRPREQRSQARAGLDAALAGAAKPEALREEFESLETKWTPPECTGFEPATQGAVAPE
ncbi:MAG: hypothetical protein JRG92_18685 [Deltaproteobacteria bacterium]|nr:hypothetical protein [Deltaproteobacteria bacterium]MBW2385663.1 hypothetical protein [Deltaproteobacteria bacterium]MBW2696779.1 hypothetical protein [Deltaproteobacteria bacterium]